MFLTGRMSGSPLLSWDVTSAALPKSLFGYDVIELIGEGAASEGGGRGIRLKKRG